MAVLTPYLSCGNGTLSYSVGIAETYSWIPVYNDQGRPIYARANYVTNLKDLQITLSASNLNIGNVKISDGNGSGSLATVVQHGTNYSLLVQTQDLDSNLDSITIGDNKGNLATVTASSLNVNVTNVNALTSNLATSINQGTTNTFLNSITANQSTAANQIVTNTLLNAVTANQASQITLANALTAKNSLAIVSNWDVLSAAAVSGSFVQLPSNLASSITILNTSGDILFIKNITKSIPLPLPNNLSLDIQLVGNTNEVAIRSTTPAVTVYGTFTLLT